MNANHARPMLAFWLLAAVAAMITSLGLRDGGSAVTVRAGSPSPVSRSGSPELVLGGVLRATPAVTPAVTAEVTAGSAAGALPDATAAFVARPAVLVRAHSAPTPSAPPKHRKVVRSSTPRTRPTSTAPTSTAPTRATAAPTATGPTRPGRGHHTGARPAKATASIAGATAGPVKSQPSPHGHAHSGRGKSGH